MKVASALVAASPNQPVAGNRTPALVNGLTMLASASGGIDVRTKQSGMAHASRRGAGLHSRAHGAPMSTAKPTHIQKIPPELTSAP
jgi:hypothetical protein